MFLKSFAVSYAFRSGVIEGEEALHILHVDLFVDSYSMSRLIELILATGTGSRGLPKIGNGTNIRKEGTHALRPVETFVPGGDGFAIERNGNRE